MKKNPKIATLQNGVDKNADGASLEVVDEDHVVLEVTGSFTADFYFEVSQDDDNFYPILGQQIETGNQATNFNSTGLYYIPVKGLFYLRARIDWTSGTNVTIKATAMSEFQ